MKISLDLRENYVKSLLVPFGEETNTKLSINSPLLGLSIGIT